MSDLPFNLEKGFFPQVASSCLKSQLRNPLFPSWEAIIAAADDLNLLQTEVEVLLSPQMARRRLKLIEDIEDRAALQCRVRMSSLPMCSNAVFL